MTYSLLLCVQAGNDHHYRRKYVNVRNTKKFDCPGKVVMKEIIFFKDPKVHTLYAKL